MDSGIAGLLGALIGGLVSWLATWSIEARRDRRQARNLAIAAASEVDASLMMVKARDWRGTFERALAAANGGAVIQVTVHVRDDYLPNCRAAMAHAGVISRDLSVFLSRLITLVDGLTSDLKRMSENPAGTPHALLSLDDPEGAARIYSHLIQITDAGFHVGSEIVTFVDRKYPRDLKGYWSRLRAAWRVITTGAI
jgi:hypothetical protein